MPSAAFHHRLQLAVQAVEPSLAMWVRRKRVPQRFADSLAHAVLGGGKRFRPFLVLETAALCGAAAAAAVETATAVELIHCYSLVHDDLPAMDNDETRRGRPTVWKAYDEWTAILAGDALLTLAFEVLASCEGVAPAVQVRLIKELARASGADGMVGGQAHDLHADKRGEPAVPDLAHIRRLQDMKTGALIRFACSAGPILAGRPEHVVAAFAAYGEHLGFAFQIADDLLDATGDASTVGKAVGKDASAGKATLVSLMGLDAARRKLDAAEAAAVACLADFGGEADLLRDAARFVARRKS